MAGFNVIKICQAHIAGRVSLEILPTKRKISDNIDNDDDNKENNVMKLI